MQHAQAALLLMLAFNLTLSTHCTETSSVQHGQRSTTAAAGPTTAATSWLSEQGDCIAYYESRRTITSEEQNLLAARTAIHDSSCSQESGWGSHGSCSTGDRPKSSWCPALLWTYTGTGNTMTRMLIEAASGWYTGSVYTDLSLVGVLPGEYFCDSRVLAVKAHPQWHSFASLSPEGFKPDTPHVPPDAKDICPCAYNRAVAVIRDPYATFLAEYKRLRTHDYNSCSEGLSDGKDCTGGHVSVVHKADFNATDFRLEVMRMANEWAAMFDSYEAISAAHPQGFYLTTFENLTNPSTRMQALVDMLQFLGVPPDSIQPLQGTCTADSVRCVAAAATDAAQETAQAADKFHPTATTDSCSASCPNGRAMGGAPGDLKGYNEGRLKCAFQLARHPLIYRPKDMQGINAQYVYDGAQGDDSLVCDVWAVVGAKAAPYGYVPYGNSQC